MTHPSPTVSPVTGQAREASGEAVDLLIVSNGHGEDAIAAHVAAALARRHPGRRMAAFPLVGEGGAYERAGIPRAFRSRPMPSGGFGWQSLRWFLQDLRAGFLSLTAAQMDALRRLRPRTRALLLVGDIYPVLLTASFAVPKVFVATARSDYISPHTRLEARLMARSCRMVFARDAVTARGLRRMGVSAACVGNVMMDLVTPRGWSLGLAEGRPVLALLPGSRHDALDNLREMAQCAWQVMARHPQLQVVAALARPVQEPHRVAPFRLQPAGAGEQEQGLDGWLAGGPGAPIRVTWRAFADLLHRATVVLGLAGTANEQAAGLGRVVVAFPRQGVQYTARFAARQKRLLGDALVLARDSRHAAQELIRLLEDPEERQRRGQEGKNRMGPAGATAQLVAWLERELGWCTTCPPVALPQESSAGDTGHGPA
ncbi:MAG TPA: lipid-A-disaccharide synthase-related protein [Limnochordales bacterium]